MFPDATTVVPRTLSPLSRAATLPRNAPSPTLSSRSGPPGVVLDDFRRPFQNHPDPVPVGAFVDDLIPVVETLLVHHIRVVDERALDQGRQIGPPGRSAGVGASVVSITAPGAGPSLFDLAFVEQPETVQDDLHPAFVDGFCAVDGPQREFKPPLAPAEQAEQRLQPERVAVEAFTGLPFSMKITPGAGVKSLMILSVPVAPLLPMIWSSSPRFRKLNLPVKSRFGDMP